MITTFLWIIALIAITLASMMLSNRLKVAYPITLVIVGLLVAIIPSTPRVQLDPEIIFILFLPPLLYESGWAVSWKELWKWRRIVGSFAFLVVFFSAAAVAVVANLVFPGFSLALGFLLGGVVSSPDAVSTAAILRFVKIPKRFSAILEGESLLNDASSLIIFRFAAVAVTTGQFIWYQAAGQFLWMVVGGVAIGVVIGYLALKLHKHLPMDANTDVVLTIVTPYLMYIAAETLEASGVIAAVCGGLYTASQRHRVFTAETRTRATHVWDTLVFLLNGVTFILVGLDLPDIIDGLRAEGMDLWQATWYGLIATLVLIIVRYISVYSAIIVTQIMKHFITVADDQIPSWKVPVIFGWAGMRGAVSLAAALSIPLMAGDVPFPHRNLIIYITFVVIFITLVVQGLTLPIMIRKMKIDDPGDYLSDEETELLLERELSRTALSYLRKYYPEDYAHNPNLRHLAKYWEEVIDSEIGGLSPESQKIYMEILERQRTALMTLNKRPDINEEIIRNYYRQLDLEETKWLQNSL